MKLEFAVGKIIYATFHDGKAKKVTQAEWCSDYMQNVQQYGSMFMTNNQFLADALVANVPKKEEE